ncbi:hypothetical protein DFH28DRAFT_1149391 [Melampsora americana]|nr:hypothetical protein DFH28DRAFT_1149391 [Melampsora americana]
MPLAKNPSQSLQVPGKSSTRTLRPPSPSQTQQGFVNTPDDSCITLTRPSTPVNETPAPLSSRLPSPQPPAVKHKIASGSAAVNKAKPNSQGKTRSSTSKCGRSPSAALPSTTCRTKSSTGSAASASPGGTPIQSKQFKNNVYEVPDELDVLQDSDVAVVGSNKPVWKSIYMTAVFRIT